MSGPAATVRVLLLGSAVLSGCTYVTSEVSRFNNLPAQTAGAKVFFVPLKAQNGSAQFVQYAASIARRLEALGFRTTGDFREADYLLVFDFGVQGAREISGAMPLFCSTGGGTAYHSGSMTAFGSGGSAMGSYSGYSYSPPTYGITGYLPYSNTVYDRFFWMKMVDVRRSTAENLVAAYEATVTSAGRAANFATISECVFDAVFQNYFRSGSEQVVLGDSCMK